MYNFVFYKLKLNKSDLFKQKLQEQKHEKTNVVMANA